MSTRIFAGVTAQGTAASETALCEEHNTPENIETYYADPSDPVTHREDCTGNDELECQECWEPTDWSECGCSNPHCQA